MTDLNIVDNDEDQTTIWKMIKDGQGVKSKKYFQDLVKLQKKSSMKVQSKTHASPKLNLTEPCSFEPMIKSSLPNEMHRIEEAKRSPSKPDTKINAKFNNLHY